jgi:hypothetical protein
MVAQVLGSEVEVATRGDKGEMENAVFAAGDLSKEPVVGTEDYYVVSRALDDKLRTTSMLLCLTVAISLRFLR